MAFSRHRRLLVLSRRLQPLAVVQADAAGKLLEVQSPEGLAELSHRGQHIKRGLSQAGITLAQDRRYDSFHWSFAGHLE